METIGASSERIACTLTAGDLEDVRGAWQKLFRTSLVSRDHVPGGLRLTFTPGGESALRQLIEIESDCCMWITFVLDGPIVTMTAEGEGEHVIREVWGADKTRTLKGTGPGVGACSKG